MLSLVAFEYVNFSWKKIRLEIVSFEFIKPFFLIFDPAAAQITGANSSNATISVISS